MKIKSILGVALMASVILAFPAAAYAAVPTDIAPIGVEVPFDEACFADFAPSKVSALVDAGESCAVVIAALETVCRSTDALLMDASAVITTGTSLDRVCALQRPSPPG